MCIFQSTLPREERRKKQSYNVRNRQFQSTLPREERPLYAFNIILYVYFNPRSHERSDAYSPCLFFKKGISIHAPTRGATPSGSNGRCVLNYFNPRSHERSDFIGLLNYNRLILFQSTLPREERPFSFKEFFSIFYFNPRSHERSDSSSSSAFFIALDFNPRSHERSDSTALRHS